MVKQKKSASKTRKRAPSRSRTVIFWVILILLPIALLLLLEMGLRTFSPGKNLDLVVDKDIGGKVVQIFNPDVTHRYFHNLQMPPTPGDTYFSKEKPAGTFRVICVGGSSTFGYPYENLGGFPSYLQDRLQASGTGTYEVLNLGISAVNSYTVLDLMPDMLTLEPDLIIVYMGHNEFYGALGVCSTANLGQNRAIIKLLLRLEHLRTFQVLRDIISGVVGAFQKSDESPRGQTLMARVVQNEIVPFGSELYRVAMANFEANLEEIVTTATDHNTPILLTTVVSNHQDMAPFNSVAAPTLSAAEADSLQIWCQRGQTELRQGDTAAAQSHFQHALDLDAGYADAWYGLADCQLAQGDTAAAQAAYTQASDLDGLRFRASSELNDIIREVARARNVPLVDVATRMAAESSAGVVGGTWMIDHLHPNTDGYFEIAKWLVQGMETAGVVHAPTGLPDTELKRLSGVSHFDRAYANIGIQILTDDWPFLGRELLRHHIHPVNDSAAVAVAEQYKSDELAWTECREKLGVYYIQTDQLDLAEREYRALSKVSPEHLPTRIQLGRLLMLQGRLDEAKAQLEIARASEPNFAPILLELGIIDHKRGQHEAAIEYLQQAIGTDRQQPTLSPQQQVEAYYTLAEAYFAIDNVEIARRLTTQLLDQLPDYTPAQQLLEKIDAQ